MRAREFLKKLKMFNDIFSVLIFLSIVGIIASFFFSDSSFPAFVLLMFEVEILGIINYQRIRDLQKEMKNEMRTQNRIRIHKRKVCFKDRKGNWHCFNRETLLKALRMKE